MKYNQMKKTISGMGLLLLLWANVSVAGPGIFYLSADAGPNQGWESNPTKGAAITIWGTSIGEARGSNYVTVAGVDLTSDMDYAEWGASANPVTAKEFKRITFWLNSSMAENNTEGIYLTVDGQKTNTLPFRIDNTGEIFFISPSGAGSMDGTSAANAFNGSHGDFESTMRRMTPGDFLYLLEGSYGVDPYVGYKCRSDAPGTAANRITLTSYPGAYAVIDGRGRGATYIKIQDDYWTIATLGFNDAYVAFGWGQDSCFATETVGAPCPRIGNKLIGCEIEGALNSPFHYWGDEMVAAANYIHTTPIDSTAYPLYISEGDNCLVADNELDGGSGYIHIWDETGSRCTSTVTDVDRVIRNLIVEKNLINMRQHGSYIFHSGIVTGTSTPSNPGTIVENLTIRNNIFYCPDGTADRSGIEIRSNNNGVNISNNVFWGLPVGITSWASGSGTDAISVTNNIFANIDGTHVFNRYALSNWVTDNNLYDVTPVFDDTADSNALVGDPMFSDPSNGKFTLPDGSPACGAASDGGDIGAIACGTTDGTGTPDDTTNSSDSNQGSSSGCVIGIILNN